MDLCFFSPFALTTQKACADLTRKSLSIWVEKEHIRIPDESWSVLGKLFKPQFFFLKFQNGEWLERFLLLKGGLFWKVNLTIGDLLKYYTRTG